MNTISWLKCCNFSRFFYITLKFTTYILFVLNSIFIHRSATKDIRYNKELKTYFFVNKSKKILKMRIKHFYGLKWCNNKYRLYIIILWDVQELVRNACNYDKKPKVTSLELFEKLDDNFYYIHMIKYITYILMNTLNLVSRRYTYDRCNIFVRHNPYRYLL